MQILKRGVGLFILTAFAIFGQTPAQQQMLVSGGSVFSGFCQSTIANTVLAVLFPFQTVTALCTSGTLAQNGFAFRAGVVSNLRVNAKTAGGTASGGVASLYKNGTVTALTCTLGTGTTCQDLTHNFTTVANDQLAVKVQSGGGTITGGPTYSSGASSCTNGTQVVTFSNNTTGTNATGTITVSATVPTGAVTMTTAGSGYAAATPPTQGTVATCTGTAVFTSGTVTVDTLADLQATFEIQ